LLAKGRCGLKFLSQVSIFIFTKAEIIYILTRKTIKINKCTVLPSHCHVSGCGIKKQKSLFLESSVKTRPGSKEQPRLALKEDSRKTDLLKLNFIRSRSCRQLHV